LKADDNRGNDVIAMITKLVTNGNNNNSFKVPVYYIFLEDIKYMTILTRQERERLVLDLYNQGKTYREISKEARISPRDIGLILNKVIEEKIEGNEEQDNTDSEKNQNREQQPHLSLSAQAYKLFSDRKTPLEVAIALNLGESEATKFYKEYWKLNQLHNLSMVYEEVKGDITPFLKLYRLSKSKGRSVKQVVDALAIANNDLPDIQCRYERLKREVSTLEFNKQQSHIALTYFNNKIETQRKALTSYRISYIRERRVIENLCNEKVRLEALVTGFKNSNEEYLKIKQAAYEEVKSVLTDSKLLLKFATLSVIESLRSNPELYNFVMYDHSNNTTIPYRPNYPSLVSEQHQQSFNDSYTALILEEAEKLYNKLTTELTNRVIAAAADIRN
jgi:phosphoribosyl-ATP pyrophosphohydrolase